MAWPRCSPVVQATPFTMHFGEAPAMATTCFSKAEILQSYLGFVGVEGTLKNELQEVFVGHSYLQIICKTRPGVVHLLFSSYEG